MKRLLSVFSVILLATLWIVPAQSVLALEETGRFGLGLHGGIYKLGLSDHSDLWTVGMLGNLDLKYQLTPKFAVGVEGSYMQTNLANLDDATKRQDGAGFTFDNVTDGPRQRAFLGGLLGEYHFMPEKKWSPFVSAGAGLYFWKWVDADGNTLMSNDAELAGTGTPTADLSSAAYELKDQELYVMGGLGVEYYPSPAVSLELGTKFRYLTHVLTDFKDDLDIVGTDPGNLDLPKAIGEVYAGVTFHFGGPKKCPPLAAEAMANPTSGKPVLAVQYTGTVTGGCPPLTYSWEFGDGGNSTGLSPSHLYQKTGNFAAKLTVTDAKGNLAQVNAPAITVACPPMSCAVTANPTSGTTPLAVAFTATPTGGCPPYTFKWDIGEGSTSTEQNPSVKIEKAGDFTARVTVTDAQGNTAQGNATYSAKPAEFIPPPDKPLILRGVNFESNKAVLLESSKAILDRVAASLLEHPDVKVEVAGHCDAQGNDEYNLKLSTARASSVREYLIQLGVDAGRLVAVGYGETQPIADNGTAEGRAENRRVELKRVQ